MKRPKLNDLLVPKYTRFLNFQIDLNSLIVFTVSSNRSNSRSVGVSNANEEPT